MRRKGGGRGEAKCLPSLQIQFQCIRCTAILQDHNCFNPLPYLQFPGERPVCSQNVPKMKVLQELEEGPRTKCCPPLSYRDYFSFFANIFLMRHRRCSKTKFFTGNFQQNYQNFFGFMLNITVIEWSGAIFHCMNQVNSGRAVAVG